MRSGLRPGLLGIHGRFVPANQIIMEGVLEMTLRVVLAVQSAAICFVVAEEQFRPAIAIDLVPAQFGMLRRDGAILCRSQLRFDSAVLPGPGVPKPNLREQMDRRGLRPAVMDSDEHENILRPGLRIFDEHVEVAIIIEDARVE